MHISLLTTLCATAALAQTPVPFPTTANHETDRTGVTTGGAFADLNRDGWPDLVVANGNDMARQRVAVYYNRGDGTFPVNPDWTSGDIDYHGHLDVGDVNGDGWPDVAVSVFLGPNGFGDRGRAKLYLNDGAGHLGNLPAWTSGDRFFSFRCALGDVDNDGDLDLAVATGESYQDPPDFDRVYFNQNGTLASLPGWQAASVNHSMDIKWCDVDGDHDLDLITVGSRGPNRLFLNNGGVLATTPAWISTDGGTNHNGNSCVLGDVDGDGLPDLATADNSQLSGSGTFRVYRNLGGTFTTTPWWQSNVFYNGYASALQLMDFDRDGDLDLVAGGWWTVTAWYRNSGGTLPTTPNWTTTGTSVVESLCFADVNRDGLRVVTAEQPAVNGAQRLFHFAHPELESLQQVIADGTPLAPNQYAFHREGGYVTLLQAPQTSLQLGYTWSEAQDLGVTNWDTTVGNRIYRRAPLVAIGVTPPGRTNFRAGEVVQWSESFTSSAMNWQPAYYSSGLQFPGLSSPWPWIQGGAMVPPAFNLPNLGMQLPVPSPLPAFLLGSYLYRVQAIAPGGVVMSTASFPFQLIP